MQTQIVALVLGISDTRLQCLLAVISPEILFLRSCILMIKQDVSNENQAQEKSFATRKSLLVYMSDGLLMGMINSIALAFPFGLSLMMQQANGLGHG